MKYALLKQQSGKRNVPVSISLVGSVEYKTVKNDIPDFNNIHRLGYVGQALVARKFNQNLSLQLSPTYVHRNYVESSAMENNVYAVGLYDFSTLDFVENLSHANSFTIRANPSWAVRDSP